MTTKYVIEDPHPNCDNLIVESPKNGLEGAIEIVRYRVDNGDWDWLLEHVDRKNLEEYCRKNFKKR